MTKVLFCDNLSQKGDQNLPKLMQNKIRKQGFTLVELMVVLGIIMLLATVGIPPLVRSRIASRESFAVSSLKSLSDSCHMYAEEYDAYPSVADGLAVLGQGEFPFLHSEIVNATTVDTAVRGFYYQYSIDGTSGSFIIIAEPKTASVSKRHFRVTDSGLIQVAPLGSTDWERL